MMADNIKCCNCGFNGLVPMASTICPQCKKPGTLAWKEDEPEEVEVEAAFFD